MDLGIKGKRALVTGSTSGLGEAIATLLAHEGAAVVVHGRDRARAEWRRIGAAGVALGDLSTDAAADAAASAAGAVDILVNNARAFEISPWLGVATAKWANTYETNVISGVRMIQRLVPTMRERGWGRVITIGGGLAVQPGPHAPDYNASLSARHNLAVSLARELRSTGVTSNVVAPGAIRTAGIEALFRHGSIEAWEDIEQRVVREIVPNDIGRLGRPEEIAAAVAFLASMHAEYISGAVLRVDGGTIRNVG